MSTIDESAIPPEQVERHGHVWTREHFDTDSYQWTREMGESEYDWNIEDVSLVGTETPIRVVTLQPSHDEGWEVTAAETAGPDYHRPGFTEVISSEYSASAKNLQSAEELVESFISDLS